MSARVWDALIGTAIVVAVFLTPLPAHTQSLGEQLTRTMSLSLARKGELKNDFGQALVDPAGTLEIDPSASVADKQKTLLRRAALYELTKIFDKAEADFTAAIQLTSPPTAALYTDRGYFYMRRTRYGDALGDFTAGMRLEPRNPRFRFAAGRVQAALGNFPGAITYYDEAIRLSSRVDPTFYLARAEAQMHLEQPRLALADYDRALALKLPRLGDRYFAFLGRGFAFLQLADRRAAIADFDSALEIDPRAFDALLWRGYARELDGQADLALDDYERAVTVDPGDRTARANLQRMRSN
jgi:tetratricopeptide (TPR) repeat protein